MKTAVIGEDDQAHIVYNRALIDFAGYYGFHPKACRPHRAKTKGKVERPFRTVKEVHETLYQLIRPSTRRRRIPGW